MSHPVKCYYCGERFDRDWEPFVRVNSQRYAHQHCAEAHAKKTGVKIEPKERVEEMSRTTAPTNQNMTKMVEEMQNFMMQTIAQASSSQIFEAVMPRIDARIKEVYGFLPEIHEVKTPTTTRKITGVLHEKFDEVLQIVSLDIPVYLTGESRHWKECNLQANRRGTRVGLLLHQCSYAGV
ncbi:MAG: hypothetical protein NC218_09120 [Acetobacter sp.]|nr:hypothetical protein [Acetobacter sp.]